MGRQRQGNSRRKQVAADDVALRDALDATRQHTLPVLPANAPTSPMAGARPSSRTPHRTLGDATAAHARVTHTPQAPREASGGRHALPDLDTNASPAPAPRPYEAPLAASPVDDLFFGSGQSSTMFSAGQPPHSPAAPGEAQLPVPVTPAERGMASYGGGQSSALLIKGNGRARHPALGIVPRRRGPRSFMSQFFAGMVMVMLLVSVLTLASPLGRGTVFAGAFQGYANAVPWVPTPTPKPPTPTPYVPPQGSNPGQQAIINDIVAIFGSYAQGAINVARCESGFDPNAWNPYAIGNSHAEGVFQVLYPSTWSTTSYSGYSPYNYDANIRAAHQIFSRDGNTWREWACQP